MLYVFLLIAVIAALFMAFVFLLMFSFEFLMEASIRSGYFKRLHR